MFDKRLFDLAPATRGWVALSVVGKWAALGASVVFAFLFAQLIAALVQGGPMASPFALVACGLVGGVGTALASWAGAKAASLGKAALRQEIFDKLVRLGEGEASASAATLSPAPAPMPEPGPEVDPTPSPAPASAAGSPASRTERAVSICGEGAEQLQLYLGQYLPQLFFAVLAPLTLFAVAAPISLPAAIVFLACVPLIPVSIVFIMKLARRAMGAYWNSYVDLGASFLEALRGLATLKLFQADEAKQQQMDAQAEGFRAKTMRLLRVQLNSVTVMELFTFGGAAAGSAVVCVQCAAGQIALAPAIALVLLALEFFMPMRTLGSYFHTAMGTAEVLDQAFELLDAPEPARGTRTLTLQVEPEGTSALWQQGAQSLVEVEFSQVGYRYPGAVVPALEGIDLRIDPDAFIGVTGVSGSGKSTLAGVLAGARTGYTGSVRIGGVELSELAPESLHAAISYVPTRPFIFAGSFRANLVLGRPDATDYDLWNALRDVNLDDFVLEAGGLDAPISEAGSNLSGGQRQRLAIARALLRDTPIYLFDEATSNIDAESERDILTLIQKLAFTKTVVVVSHRLSALVWADEILVMDAGRVAERGGHGQLARAGGMYARLWAQQQQLESLAREAEAARAQSAAADGEAQVEVPAAMAEALEKMPASIAAVTRSLMKGARIRALVDGRAPTMPAGHPAGIPIPSEATPQVDLEPAPTPGIDVGAALEPPAQAGECPGSDDFGKLSGSGGSGQLFGPDGRHKGRPYEGRACDPGSTDAPEEGRACDPGSTDAPREGRPAGMVGLVRLCGRVRGLLACSCVLAVLGAAAAVGVVSFSIAGLLEGTPGAVALTAGGTPLLALAVALAVLCGILRAPLRYGERLTSHNASFKTLASIRSRVFSHMRSLAPARLEARSTGDLISLLTSDVEVLEGFYTKTLAPAVSLAVVAIVFAVAVALAASPAFALAALLAFALVGYAIPVALSRWGAEEGRQLKARAVRFSSFLRETIAGLPTLLRFDGASLRRDELGGRMGALAAAERGARRRAALRAGAVGASWQIALAACAFVGVAAVASGAGAAGPASGGEVALALAVSPQAVPVALGLAALYSCGVVVLPFAQASAASQPMMSSAERILDFLVERPETPDIPASETTSDSTSDPATAATPAQAATPSSAPVPAGALRHVDFSRSGDAILRDFSLEIPAGQVVHLGGRSGAGKSTICKLLLRYWSADAGAVEVFGRNVEQTPTSSLRRVAAYMPQDTVVFAGSIADNIRFVRPDATRDELLAAAEQAALGPLISRLPQGIDAPAAGLSEGERQRIGLARLFLYDAPFMLLDEPTSNLDCLNEAAVLRALAAAPADKTMVIVSHRASAAAIADVSYTVNEGRLS